MSIAIQTHALEYCNTLAHSSTRVRTQVRTHMHTHCNAHTHLFAPAVAAAVGAPITIEQWEGGRRVALRAEFNQLFVAYSAWVRTVVWRVYGGKHGCPDIPAADADVDVFHHLVHVNTSCR